MLSKLACCRQKKLSLFVKSLFLVLFIGVLSVLISTSHINTAKAESILDAADSTTAATGITCKDGTAASGLGIVINWLPGEGADSSQKTIG